LKFGTKNARSRMFLLQKSISQTVVVVILGLSFWIWKFVDSLLQNKTNFKFLFLAQKHSCFQASHRSFL